MLTSAISLSVCIDSRTRAPDGQRRKASSLINELSRETMALLLPLLIDKGQQRSSVPQTFRRSFLFMLSSREPVSPSDQQRLESLSNPIIPADPGEPDQPIAWLNVPYPVFGLPGGSRITIRQPYC
jgi:hypothetical protein